jgi:hypothetical protein
LDIFVNTLFEVETNEQVRFARRRFGRYEVIDFLAVQIALPDQWRKHPGSVLREPSAHCHSIHGARFS